MNYGKLDVLWFDFSYDSMTGEKWQAEKFVKMIRSCQPDVLIDNRLEASGDGFGSIVEDEPNLWSGDFVSPENIIPLDGLLNKRGEPIPWEACITMNKNWGYCAGDKYFKPVPMIIRKLVECVSKNGNMLLNVGPDARGIILAESLQILEGIGLWMELNGDSIYGCGSADLAKPEWGRFTKKGNIVFAHVVEPPIGPLHLPGIPREKARNLRLLRDKSELKLSCAWMTHAYQDLTFLETDPLTHDCMLPDNIDSVIKVEIVE